MSQRPKRVLSGFHLFSTAPAAHPAWQDRPDKTELWSLDRSREAASLFGRLCCYLSVLGKSGAGMTNTRVCSAHGKQAFDFTSPEQSLPGPQTVQTESSCKVNSLPGRQVPRDADLQSLLRESTFPPALGQTVPLAVPTWRDSDADSC